MEHDPTLLSKLAMQTLLVAIAGGILAQWVSHVIRLPAIIPLLAFGILLGPEGPDWLHLMPRPSEALPNALQSIVALGVAVVLFEGGLSLNINDLRLAPQTVRNLVSVGAAISFLGAALCAHFVASLDWQVSFLYGALMIVTGPTVIGPLLKNVRIVRRAHTVLLWEGILIDAVGAITAVVTLELILEEVGVLSAGGTFLGALLVGPAIGGIGGYLLARWLKFRKRKGLQEEELDPLIALGGALALYGISEAFFHESGLGAVTCAGLVMANVLKGDLEELRRFKGTLTTLLVSVLFMLLAADFHLADLAPLWPAGFVAIAVLMLVVRPLNIVACTWGSNLNWREKLFLSWIAPRGIVAASVASLFALKLTQTGSPELAQAGKFLVALTFSTIMVTVVLNGLTAKLLAKLLGIEVAKPEGLLIAGANALAVRVAGLFETRGIPTLLVDTNPLLCERAREAGFRVLEGSILDEEFLDEQDMSGIGRFLALTPSSVVNARAAVSVANDLRLSPSYLVVAPMASSAELAMVNNSDAARAFSEEVDINTFNVLIADGRCQFRSRRIVDGKPAEEMPEVFMPVAVVVGGAIQPYAVGTPIPSDCEVVGLEIPGMTHDDHLPFDSGFDAVLAAAQKAKTPKKASVPVSDAAGEALDPQAPSA